MDFGQGFVDRDSASRSLDLAENRRAEEENADQKRLHRGTHIPQQSTLVSLSQAEHFYIWLILWKMGKVTHDTKKIIAAMETRLEHGCVST